MTSHDLVQFKSLKLLESRSGNFVGDCWQVAGDDSSIPAETVAGVFVCFGTDHLCDSRLSRRMGGGSFPAGFLSNLETRYYRAGRQSLAARTPLRQSVDEPDDKLQPCFVPRDAFDEGTGRRTAAHLLTRDERAENRGGQRQAAGPLNTMQRVELPFFNL